jgi:hypothetical protein
MPNKPKQAEMHTVGTIWARGFPLFGFPCPSDLDFFPLGPLKSFDCDSDGRNVSHGMLAISIAFPLSMYPIGTPRETLQGGGDLGHRAAD